MDSPPSIFSAEGTAAHSIAHYLLVSGGNAEAPAHTLWSADGFKGHFQSADLAAIQSYIDCVRREPGLKFYEVDTPGTAERGGTADAVALDVDARNIHVFDLKFGKGVPVDAQGNLQMLEYAVGALRKFDYLCDWETVTTSIVQPRRDHFDSWTYTRAEVETHDVDMSVAAVLSLTAQKLTGAALDAARTPSEGACLWCPIRSGCVARSREIINMFKVLT